MRRGSPGHSFTFMDGLGARLYALDDLKTWADLGAKTSTSDPGKGTVLPAKRHPALRPYAGQERR
jgi:hypothetical protein